MKLFACTMWIGWAALLSGEPARTGLVRGIILELRQNELSVQSAPGDIYRFHFDSRTWIERERERIPGASLRTGEVLEVVSDRGGEYARLIHVLDVTVPKPPVRPGQFRLYRKHTDTPPDQGLLVYTGVVSGFRDGTLILRTRMDGSKTIYLRPDTRCLDGGAEVRSESLQPHMHVSVTAAANNDGELEAFQIIWGNLLQPELNRQ